MVPQPNLFNMHHTHNQRIQHGCEAEAEHSTTQQQPKINLNPKRNPGHKQKRSDKATATLTKNKENHVFQPGPNFLPKANTFKVSRTLPSE